MRWEKVETGGEERPGKRWGHTCNATIDGRFLYLFGGYSGHRHRQTNQVHVFDNLKQTWSRVITRGFPPTPRDSHSCTADDDDNLFVYGGSDGTNPLNDLYILNTSTHEWSHPIARGEVPLARKEHGAAFVGKRLFIFGGCARSPDNIKETFVWTRPTTSGTPPCPRDSHTCSSWKNKIVVIGGVEEHDSYLSDVHILDTDTLIWRELYTSGKLLPPRAGHSTVSFGKNLFVFGGFAYAHSVYNDLYMLDIDTGIWTEVATGRIGPSARFAAAGDCLHFAGGILVFFGGCNESFDALDDMYQYYLYAGIQPEKFSLRKKLTLKCQEQIPYPVQSQVLFGYGVGADSSQPSRLNIHPSSLPISGKRACQIKITESISDWYTIETIIDGKRLHGILFRNKPNLLNPATNTSSRRKRTADETVSVFSNDMHRDNLTMSKVLKHSGTGDRWKVQEYVANVIPSNPITAGASETFKASADPELAAASLNGNDNEKIDKSKNDGANDMTRSEGEVQTDNQTNVPISNNKAPRLERHDQKSDIPKPAAAEGGACLSNQGVKDCTTQRVEDTENQQI